MSKFIKFGNGYLRKKSIIAIHLQKEYIDKNYIQITTNELTSIQFIGSGGFGNVKYNIEYGEKKLEAENYFNDLIKELENDDS